jgi:HlyD family secretion protein
VAKFLTKKRVKWLVGIGAVVLVGFFGYRYWKGKQSAIPEGIVWGNGRIEAQQVDVSAKEPLRVKEVLVDEGALVKPGQVLAQLDTVTLDAELAQAQATLAAAREKLAVAGAAIVKRKSEIDLAKIEEDRARRLAAQRAGSLRELDVRRMAVQTTAAGLKADEANMQVAHRDVDAAEAKVETVQTRINDATLKSPVVGRVLYRLAEPGEVLGPGGKALSLVNLQDVYMQIFLPSAQAAAIKIGADARITVDYEPNRAAQGYVSFVSPEAQFTPKEVETRSEREKLMFRVKIQLPNELVAHYIERIKTGVRGVGYVKIKPTTPWPERLDRNLLRPEEVGPPHAEREAPPDGQRSAAKLR